MASEHASEVSSVPTTGAAQRQETAPLDTVPATPPKRTSITPTASPSHASPLKAFSRDWINVQQKTFVAWINSHLQKRGAKIETLENAFETGENLIYLIEELSHSSEIHSALTSKMVKNPTHLMHKIQNCDLALEFLQKYENVRVVGCSAKEIQQSNIKIVLGLIWTLILHFQINIVAQPLEMVQLSPGTLVKREGEQLRVNDLYSTTASKIVPHSPVTPLSPKRFSLLRSPTSLQVMKFEGESSVVTFSSQEVTAEKDLTNWVKRVLQPFDTIQIKNLAQSWSSGLALNLLVTRLAAPEQHIDFAAFVQQKETQYKQKYQASNVTFAYFLNEDAIEQASKSLEIPKLVDPQDVTETPEKLSMMTYLSYFREYQINNQPERYEASLPTSPASPLSPPQSPVKQVPSPQQKTPATSLLDTTFPVSKPEVSSKQQAFNAYEFPPAEEVAQTETSTSQPAKSPEELRKQAAVWLLWILLCVLCILLEIITHRDSNIITDTLQQDELAADALSSSIGAVSANITNN